MTKRIRVLDFGQVEFWSAVILATLVMASCGLALSNLTYPAQAPKLSLPLMEGDETGGSSADERQDAILPYYGLSDARGNGELRETLGLTPTEKTGRGSRLIFPWVVVGESVPLQEGRVFLPLFTKPRGLCVNRVVRTGDKLTFNSQEVKLIGMNVAYILEEWFPEDQWEEIFKFLSQYGNTVRIPVFPEHAQDLDRVERLIRLGGKYDLWFIIVLEGYMAADYPTKNEWWFRYGYKTEYMDHLRNVVTRLRDRPEIALWQLMGEPSCAPEGGRRSCYNALVEWARVSSEEIKKLDPCRPVAVGMISVGGPQPQGEEAWRKMHTFPSIDAVTIHAWTDVWYERELRIADELNLPVLYTEVYHRAYKKNGRLLRKGVLEERVTTLQEFMQRSFEAGVDGIILWQYTHQGYPGELDYKQSDPVWEVLGEFSEGLGGTGRN